MNVTEPGKVTDRITLLGRPESCVELIDGGGEYALLGGAMSYVVPDLLEQIERFGIDEKKIKRLVVLHSHFDHCGMIPYLAQRWPWATVTASARAKDLLANPKVSGTIAFMNEAATARFGRTDEVKQLGCGFTRIDVEQAVGHEDVLHCGEVTLRILEVPGHSSCSIAVYVPEEKALFPSDAAGIAYGDFFLSAGNSNFDKYQQSLEVMVKLDVEVLLKEHYGGHLGEDARAYLPRAIEEAKKTRLILEEKWRQTGDVKEAAEMVLDQLCESAPLDFLPREVLSLVVGQMVKFISRSLSEG